MNRLIFKARPQQAKTMITQRDYLVRADVESRLNYSYVSEQNLPIGSGAIELLLTQSINLLGIILKNFLNTYPNTTKL
jgi:hypothetical protein